MLDTRNRSPYRQLAEECCRLVATSAPSSQVKNRYLFMAQDYMWLADLKEQARTGTPPTVEENAVLPVTSVARLPAVGGMPLTKRPTAVPKSTSFEPDERMSSRSLPRPRDPRSNRKKFLTPITVAIAVAALPAGYFVVRNSDRQVDITAVPRATTDIPPVKSAAATNVESRVEPEVQAPSLQ